ncbi:hypothetical protein RJP21_03405 [Paenibacillus sp. VCA1]|nr:hypothetical protein [Paenibacillus sp. VCA1]MDR9852648.1 hypothetical protein [Paenibacillus sp. VCA1]
MIAKVAASKIQSNGDENDGRAFAAWVIGKATAFEKYPEEVNTDEKRYD